MADHTLNYIGLAYKAGKIILGEAIFSSFKKIHLLFIATDISRGSLMRYQKKCNSYHIPLIQAYTSDELSHALGKYNIKACAITDEGFAKTIIERRCINGETNQKEKSK